MAETQPDDLGLIPERAPCPRALRRLEHHRSLFRLVLKKEEAARGDRDPGNLTVVVNRYLPCSTPPIDHNPNISLTPVVAHACGVHKEVGHSYGYGICS